MGKRYLVDSNVIIGYLDAKIPANGMAFMHGIINDVPNISVMSKIEVLSFNAPENPYKILTEFVNTAIVFDLTDEVVEQTINLRKQHKSKTPDAIIAATALVHDLTLITRNVSDFNKVDGLEIIDPYNM